ncbi:MAG: bifunctional pyr operon transcriptional regulator/uracil phosphoribosyltransferase PyrR [Gammaproteobacteria bacterium]|nr:bifunctional pyr operon transcriptional regulator/uracil phosphoribosyltransferase PyrR [Gammaproteobacteria bacterium]
MSRQLQQRLAQRPANPPLMVGIHSGGVWVARRLHRMLDLTTPLAMLNISFYRDDFTRVGINPQVRPSDMPLSVDDRDIILVDDVLYTGRTVRAALNELFDYGRPASITLAVLVDRGGRELPIQAAVTGMTLQLPPGQHVKLKGPEPMTLSVEGAP